MDPIQLTKDLVSINSANPFSTVSINGKEYGIGNEEKINDYLESLLIQHGFDVHKQVYQEEMRVPQPDGTTTIIPKRWNVLAQKGNAKKSILFLGHTDTVDVKEGWECDPFIGEERVVDGEKRFFALGSNDMKAGIAAMIAATAHFNPQQYTIKIALVSDEEFWSYGAHALVESGYLSDVSLCLVPELLEYALDDRDVGWLGVGRLGRVEYEVSLEGVACHGADAFVSQEAVNAVHESALLQAALVPFLRASQATFSQGEVRVINSAYINLASGGKGILSVPDTARFIVDRNLIPSETIESELEKLREFVSKVQKEGSIDPRVKVNVNLRKRPTPPCDAYYVDENSPIAHFIKTQILKEYKKLHVGIGRTVADENRIAKLGIPTFIIPPRGGNSHTNKEWLDLESVHRVTNVFRSICENMID